RFSAGRRSCPAASLSATHMAAKPARLHREILLRSSNRQPSSHVLNTFLVLHSSRDSKIPGFPVRDRTNELWPQSRSLFADLLPLTLFSDLLVVVRSPFTLMRLGSPLRGRLDVVH